METARREHPDLMLVDLQMPDMDGFQVVEMMRADPRLATIPVMVLTSETSTQVETKVLEMGADDYVMKPFEPEVLLSRVRGGFQANVGGGVNTATPAAPAASVFAEDALQLVAIGGPGQRHHQQHAGLHRHMILARDRPLPAP